MRVLILLIAMVAVAGAQTNETAVASTNTTAVTSTNNTIKIRVTGDRVSLRAAPGLDGYLLDRAMRGEEMAYLGKTNEWVAVQAPDSLDFWVASEYVQNGVVQPEKLNVRAGPSKNYPVVAVLSKGDAVSLRGEFNNWLKIAPPTGSKVWISAKYTELIEPPAPKPQVAESAPAPQIAESASKPEVQAPATKAAPETAKNEVKADNKKLPPLMLVLDPNKKQGVYVELPGVLRRANPGLYKLVLIDGGFEEPICLVRGSEKQMESLLNRSMLIKGKRYWAKDVDIPIVQPEKIKLDPIIKN